MKIHTLGFPRIGAQRELKFALEAFWRGEQSAQALEECGKNLRKIQRDRLDKLDFVTVGDFSFYDHILDASFLFGNVPQRVKESAGSELDRYFRAARGRSANDVPEQEVAAGEMTKWFDTNYHYIVPEFLKTTRFSLNAESLLRHLREAVKSGKTPKVVLSGPVTYLWLGKTQDGSDRLSLLDDLLPEYIKLFHLLQEAGAEWIQLDEPILVTELSEPWQNALKKSYAAFAEKSSIRILLATYFGKLKENLPLALSLPVAGFHLDAVCAEDEIEPVLEGLTPQQIFSVGIIDGRNVWKSDLTKILDRVEPIFEQLGDRLWLAPSCSLLHVPVDLESETQIDPEILNWLAFAQQKLEELHLLKTALEQGRDAIKAELKENRLALEARKNSPRTCSPEVRKRLQEIRPEMQERKSPYSERTKIQRKKFNFPLLPTTTIGSFPQTRDIRATRLKYKKGEINQTEYIQKMHNEIQTVVRVQEELGLDLLVHGEPERNDMVEYFGEQLSGYVFSRFGWVQSYGSRCVKPPILFGDVDRPAPMTIEWIRYAQDQTDKPMKGMLTGPVTILNWSFVRDDQPLSETCAQLALAIRDEVLDLEKAGIEIIQIDEAALREGLPLRRSEWDDYLDWAIRAFKITANGVADSTQIHTHMCYSEFNDIIAHIAKMDADVITIETSRSNMELLDAFREFEYPNEIGPGVYDIHSPNVPSVEAIVHLMEKAMEHIPIERLWVNPDCGLKTRAWPETKAALAHMVQAAQILRTKPK